MALSIYSAPSPFRSMGYGERDSTDICHAISIYRGGAISIYRGEYLDVDLICASQCGRYVICHDAYYFMGGRVDQPTIAVDQPGLNRPTS